MAAISIQNLNKTYGGELHALDGVNLEIKKGEVFALLGPNGAGKTTLIETICGIVTPDSGVIKIFDHDIKQDFRQAKQKIGLVPQELKMETFSTVFDAVSFSRQLYGKRKNSAYVEDLIKRMALWEKKDSELRFLSGGMKRRVLIAKALAHEPRVLFLDEPTAGVDVELRIKLLEEIHLLKQAGLTIVLTTHYIEEAEKIADRVGVINNGKILTVEDKKALMKRMAKKKIIVSLSNALSNPLKTIEGIAIDYCPDEKTLSFELDPKDNDQKLEKVLSVLKKQDIGIVDLQTRENSLEEIFLNLIGKK